MAQGNFVWVRGDITGDIYYDHLANDIWGSNPLCPAVYDGGWQ